MSVNQALVFNAVSRSFGGDKARVKALDTISLEVPTGIICGLIGPDGAGKSTLMRLAAGLLLPDNGTLQVQGIDVVHSPLQVQSAVSYMPQRFGLYEDLTVQENLDLYANLQGVEPNRRPAIYQELMHMTALGAFTRRLAGHLSGGMKQKLGLACSLVRTPRLLLLDEPTAGVDPLSRRELWGIIKRLVRQDGISVLLSTAYLDEAESCDEVVLMHEGRLLGQGSPQQFSDTMKGRTFHVSSAVLNKRQLQHRLANVPAVLDAVIDNERIRVVSREARVPELGVHLTGMSDVSIEVAEPIFEDAFIAALKHESVATQTIVAEKARAVVADGVVIEASNVQKRFGRFYAVKGISFSVRRGEVFGLLGANGAGKSTTFRMLCGLLPVSAGEVMVAGRDLRRAAAEARSGLGYMAQRFSLYANLTVMENLKFFARAYGLGHRQCRQRIDWALETFELSAYSDNESGDLPLGYKQRLALAAALLHEPEILFLDEPTSGVDPLARREFWQRINALAEAGVTVLITTHFMAEADYCDRLVIMADGEILAQGTPADLKARFRTDVQSSPSMEDAFVALIAEHTQTAGAAA